MTTANTVAVMNSADRDIKIRPRETGYFRRALVLDSRE
jgi:hypothetical protein